MLNHNIEAMTKCLAIFPDQRFTFDVHAMYFKRVTNILNAKAYSALAEEFKDAFRNAAIGQDDGTQLLTLWVPWIE